MVGFSYDSASCSEENGGSMKKIRQEMKVGGHKQNRVKIGSEINDLLKFQKLRNIYIYKQYTVVTHPSVNPDRCRGLRETLDK